MRVDSPHMPLYNSTPTLLPAPHAPLGRRFLFQEKSVSRVFSESDMNMRSGACGARLDETDKRRGNRQCAPHSSPLATGAMKHTTLHATTTTRRRNPLCPGNSGGFGGSGFHVREVSGCG